MSNFSPKLEEANEVYLLHLINESSPQFGSLASDELTRRESKKHYGVLEKNTKEIGLLRNDLKKYSKSSKAEEIQMRYLTFALGAVALLQLFIAYGQYRLGEVQTNFAHEQVATQNAVWEYEKMRNDRLETRDVNWRREDLEFEGRLPSYGQ